MKQSGRHYTLFIPTNAALQSMGKQTNADRLRQVNISLKISKKLILFQQFVLRHVCADVLLDPMSNVLRRSAGFYNRAQNIRQTQSQRSRRKRQNWFDSRRNDTNVVNRQGVPPTDLGPNYFQPQQQVYGGYPGAPSPYDSNNQLYNPSYVMSGQASPNSQYFPGYNGTYLGAQQFNYNNFGLPNQQNLNNPWNRTMNGPYNPQVIAGPNDGSQIYNTGSGGFNGASTYVSGPQSCTAMTGERITVQSLGGTQPGGMKIDCCILCNIQLESKHLRNI